MLDDPEPEERFQQTLVQSQTSDYQVSYDVSASGAEDLSGIISDISLTSHQDEYAFTTSINLLGSPLNFGFYETETGSVTCSEGSGFLGGEGSLDCTVSDDEIDQEEFTEFFDILEEEDMELTYEEETEIEGRSCEMFRFETSEDLEEELDTDLEEQEDLAEQQLGQDFGYDHLIVEICLDSQKGYPSHISVDTIEDTEIAGETQQEIIGLTGQLETSDISREDIMPPVNSALNLECEPEEAEITSLSFTGTAELETAEENIEVELVEGETETVDLEDYELEADELLGQKEVTLHAGDTELTDTCYTTSDDYFDDTWDDGFEDDFEDDWEDDFEY